MTMFSDLLRRDRERYGLSVDQAARALSVTPAEYQRLERGEGVAELGDVRADRAAVWLATDVRRAEAR